MKSIVFILLVIQTLLVTTLTYAQSSKISVGIEGGVGFSNSMIGINSPGIGYAAKLTSQYDLSKILSINIGVGYEQRSSTFHAIIIDSINPVDFSDNSKFDFLTLPILLRASFGSKVKYFINAGPYFSYLLKAHGYMKDNIENTKTYSEGTDYYKRFESGISFGTGVSIPIAQQLSLLIEARGNVGLTNLSKTEGATHKTNSAHVLVGLSYHL